jgi:hypothetical protein
MKLRLTQSEPLATNSRPAAARTASRPASMTREPPPAVYPFPSSAVRQMHQAADTQRQKRLDRLTHRPSTIHDAERSLERVEFHAHALLNQLATEARTKPSARRSPSDRPDPPRAA